MHAPSEQRSWQLLLIGGSSGVGKTIVSQALAAHFGISRLLVDDVRLALQELTLSEHHPELHHLEATPAAWRESPEAFPDRLIATSAALEKPLATIIAHHVVVAGVGPLIIEGDNVTPQLAAKRDFSDQKFFSRLVLADQVRSLFIVEPDEHTILANMRARGRGFDQLAPAEQRTEARASWLYGQWLQREAEQRHLPVVPSRPWDTLLQRALSSIAAR
jgi:2-phosphoglycerate kinase